MRNTMPRGESVQRATQSTKRMSAGRNAGASRLAVTALRLAPAAVSRMAQTTPSVSRVPSGTSTRSPAFSARPAGTR